MGPCAIQGLIACFIDCFTWHKLGSILQWVVGSSASMKIGSASHSLPMTGAYLPVFVMSVVASTALLMLDAFPYGSFCFTHTLVGTSC